MLKKLLSSILLLLAFVLPTSALGANYVIQRGDTLTSIARRFDTTVASLVQRNNIEDPNRIYAGDFLEVEEIDEPTLGAGYTPVTGYQSRTTSFVSAAATTIPVASTKDKANNQISLGSVSASSTVRVYLSLSTGTSREEIIACTGVTTISWTNCSRGLSFQGGSMTPSSTLAFAHNAGTPIIITDVGQFFTEFVSITGDQTIEDVKTFQAFPVVSSTTALPTTNGQFATKYYVDQVGAGGFTAANVSSTRGLSVDGSAPERVGVNASTTRGLAFDTAGDGNLYINASSTGGIGFAVDGSVEVDTTDNFSFSGNVTSTGSLRAPTPTLDADVATKLYTDTEIRAFTATGTVSGSVTAGRAVFATATSSIGTINNSSGTSTFSFVGIAENTATEGAEAQYTRPGGVNCNQSGLTPGAQYYLNGTAGQISTTPGTNIARIGVALSATCLQVSHPKYIASGTLTFSNVASGATVTATTNFYPANISFIASSETGNYQNVLGNADFISVGGNEGHWSLTNGSSFFTLFCLNDGVYCVQDQSGSRQFSAAISSRTATGFVVTHTQNSGSAGNFTSYIRWTAESL